MQDADWATRRPGDPALILSEPSAALVNPQGAMTPGAGPRPRTAPAASAPFTYSVMAISHSPEGDSGSTRARADQNLCACLPSLCTGIPDRRKTPCAASPRSARRRHQGLRRSARPRPGARRRLPPSRGSPHHPFAALYGTRTGNRGGLRRAGTSAPARTGRSPLPGRRADAVTARGSVAASARRRIRAPGQASGPELAVSPGAASLGTPR